MSVKIIVDSTVDMNPGMEAKVTVVPLTIRFGEKEYVSGVDIDARRFYEMLVESDVLPTTSQPTPYAFEQVFTEAVEAGDEVVCITIASKLSGTYQSATIAAENFPGKVFVVDSKNATIASGILAEYSVSLADQGRTAREIYEELAVQRDKVKLLAMVDTLEYLKKGGRVSATVAFAGGLLNIKPVISVEDGEVKMMGKARGSKQANNLLVQMIQSCGVDFTKPLLLGYTGLSDVLLQKYMVDSAALWECHRQALPTTIVGSVIGVHAGPGAVAVAFFAE